VWRYQLLLVLGCGCGRIGFDAAGGDGRIDDGISGDGVADGLADATVLGIFSAPTNVTELNLGGTNTEDPTLTDDRLEIVFSSTRAAGLGGVDLWTATRASPNEMWSAPSLIAGVNSTSDDTTPELTGDGLVLLFASSRPGGAGLYDLYQATRASRGAAWGAPVRIVELASTADEFAGSIAPDRLTIVFSSSRSGGAGGGDIYQAVRTSTGATWNPPTLISELVSAADDSAPWMSADGRTFAFSSTRAGGQGSQDVYTSVRATTADLWGAPVVVSELNDANYDSDPWLASDLRTMFYSRNAGSVRNIFMATR
jgi:Tol biopolymer transport system component